MKVVVFKYYNSAKELETMDDIMPLMILILSRLPLDVGSYDHIECLTDFVNTIEDRDFSFEEINI